MQKEIRDFAGAWEVPPDTVDKDYVLGHIRPEVETSIILRYSPRFVNDPEKGFKKNRYQLGAVNQALMNIIETFNGVIRDPNIRVHQQSCTLLLL